MNAIHICLIAFVLFVQRKQKVIKQADPEDNFKHLFNIKKIRFPWFMKYVMPSISLYLMFNHKNTIAKMHNISEFAIILAIYIYTIKAFKQCANPYATTNATEYTFGANLLLALCVCYYNVIDPTYQFNYIAFSTLAQMTTLLNDKKTRKILTTTQFINESALTFLMFLLYKKHLKFI